MLKTREYTITVETHNQYVVVITANSEESAIEIAEQNVVDHQADLEDMTIIETEIVEVNDA